MADLGSVQNLVWPLPKFRFQVDFGTTASLMGIAFQEVSGLDTETQIIEYRHSNNPLFSTIKMPGITKYGNVTMKRGVFTTDYTFWTWYSQIQMNTIARVNVLVKLLDEQGNVTFQWTLVNAWPTKITHTDLKSDANEAAIDTIEIAHEQLIINMP